MVIEIKNNGVITAEVQAVGGPVQFEIKEIIHTGPKGAVAAVKTFGVMAKEKDETVKAFAIRIIKKTMQE